MGVACAHVRQMCVRLQRCALQMCAAKRVLLHLCRLAGAARQQLSIVNGFSSGCVNVLPRVGVVCLGGCLGAARVQLSIVNVFSSGRCTPPTFHDNCAVV